MQMTYDRRLFNMLLNTSVAVQVIVDNLSQRKHKWFKILS